MGDRGKANVIPGMRYKDASAAIDWLCNAFGLARHFVVPDDDGGISHAQLVLGNGMSMLGSAREGNEYDSLVKLLIEVGANTQATYIVVEDVDGHYRRAVAAGADIVYEIGDQHYGGRLYSARDPEGHLWNFGSYDPWAEISD